MFLSVKVRYSEKATKIWKKVFLEALEAGWGGGAGPTKTPQTFAGIKKRTKAEIDNPTPLDLWTFHHLWLV